MSRWLAGVLSAGADEEGGRLRGALGELESRQLSAGPLRVSYTGPRVADAGIVCLLDGHLDNCRELREQIGPAGAGADEEEILAAAYERWGAEMLARLRGDFALLLWDRERRRGLLARDQIGARSLFLHGSGGTLRFASEVTHLLRILPSRPAPDQASLAHWIAGSTRPGPQTLYEGVRRLGPGAVLLIDGESRREQRYWKPRFAGELELEPAQLGAAVRAALTTSVRRRSGGRTAILMSGGLDSASIAAVGAQEDGAELIACSATFPDHPATDESVLIAELRERLALRGPVAAVRPGGLLVAMVEYLERWQMPLLGWGDFWTNELLGAAAAAGAETVLGGDGGDELFGPRAYLLADRLRGGHPLQALRLARSLPGAGAGVSRRQVAGAYRRLALLGAVPERLQRIGAARRSAAEAPAWMRPAGRRALGESDDPSAWKRLDGPRWWADAAHGVHCAIEQSGVYEHQRRRAAMHGLQARHPMLDLDLVEVGLRQPPGATLDPRFNRPVLREAMAGLLPDSVRLRPAKAWFDSLVVDSLIGADAALVRGLLNEPDAELGAYLDIGAMDRALFQGSARAQDPFRWMAQVWRLLTAQTWLRQQSRPEAILPPGALPSAPRVELAAAAD